MTESSTSSESEESGAGFPDAALAAQAVAQVLQPLARLMIGHGLQLPSMVELLKKALVDEAALAYGLEDRITSDSRIALLTGVHRKDVRRLREANELPELATPMVPVAASVVARWISDPRFLNADQSPRVLARTPKRGVVGESDFTKLVAEVSRDVGARAVLDELARLGVVEIREDGYVVLKASAFVPKEGLQESFHFLAANVRDHLATAVHNLTPKRSTPAKLEQCAFVGDLSEPQVVELQARARQLWTTALQQFLQTATVAKQRSQAEPGPRYRVRFGAYFHDAPQVPGRIDVERPVASPKRNRKSSTP
ncbi:MAG: hypothetical protein RJB64_697 [Pseudomonadota bacterium]|jgi:hypothetical protein